MESLFPRSDDLTNLPWLSISAVTGSADISVQISDDDGEIRYVKQPLPLPFEWVWDIRTVMFGGKSFSPRDDNYMRPLGATPVPYPPTYDYACKMRVFIVGHGMAEWTTTSNYNLNVINACISAYLMTSEAEQGWIPSYNLLVPRPRDNSAWRKTFQQMRVELRGYVKRDSRWGTPTVPLPSELARIQAAAAAAPAAQLEYMSLRQALPQTPPAPVTVTTAGGPVTMESAAPPPPPPAALEDDEIVF